MLAKRKLNSIEDLASQSLIDLEISYKEFKIVVDEKEKNEKMTENVRMTKSDIESSESNKNIRRNNENA